MKGTAQMIITNATRCRKQLLSNSDMFLMAKGSCGVAMSQDFDESIIFRFEDGSGLRFYSRYVELI